MDRTETIREYLKPYILKRIHEKTKTAEGVKNDSLIAAVTAALSDAVEMRSMQPAWKPVYMGLFHLMTSLVTESYEYELMITDEQLYLDEFQIVKTWCPDFLYHNVQEEKDIKKELGARFVRLNSYEIAYAKKHLFYEYRSIMEVYWKKQISEIIKLEEFQKLKPDIPVRFLFGDYMGEIHMISD